MLFSISGITKESGLTMDYQYMHFSLWFLVVTGVCVYVCVLIHVDNISLVQMIVHLLIPGERRIYMAK